MLPRMCRPTDNNQPMPQGPRIRTLDAMFTARTISVLLGPWFQMVGMVAALVAALVAMARLRRSADV